MGAKLGQLVHATRRRAQENHPEPAALTGNDAEFITTFRWLSAGG
jgi:hypothetical protein